MGLINAAMAVGMLVFVVGLIWWRWGGRPREDRRPRRVLRVVLTISGSLIVLAVGAYIWFLIQLRNCTF
ncbi:hypothetical protein [Cellulomonas sp. Y8]|uniref:hypothetical protein n=1 Tax=Cellulomonas sp. Y8 TaxID=2591145 RepID=UPI0011C93A8C|nr:hypothetical protein [Cellulomonas sp. Y8]